MRFLQFPAAALVAFGLVQPALGQAKQTAQTPNIDTRQVTRATFSGSESWITNFYHVQSDCTSGPEPEVRVVAKAKNGEVHFEQRKFPISFPKEAPRAHCNGKPVDAVSIVYKSKDGFIGTDRMTLEVNYRDVNVIRYVYTINVR